MKANALNQKALNLVKKLWNDESGQGATEYILLLVVVVALAMAFKDQIGEAVSGKMGEVQGSLGDFNADF